MSQQRKNLQSLKNGAKGCTTDRRQTIIMREKIEHLLARLARRPAAAGTTNVKAGGIGFVENGRLYGT